MQLLSVTTTAVAHPRLTDQAKGLFVKTFSNFQFSNFSTQAVVIEAPVHISGSNLSLQCSDLIIFKTTVVSTDYHVDSSLFHLTSDLLIRPQLACIHGKDEHWGRGNRA